jgi:hypothetical protein
MRGRQDQMRFDQSAGAKTVAADIQPAHGLPWAGVHTGLQRTQNTLLRKRGTSQAGCAQACGNPITQN